MEYAALRAQERFRDQFNLGICCARALRHENDVGYLRAERRNEFEIKNIWGYASRAERTEAATISRSKSSRRQERLRDQNYVGKCHKDFETKIM